MKKVLILAYDFPPYVSVGAVLSESKYGLRPFNCFGFTSDPFKRIVSSPAVFFMPTPFHMVIPNIIVKNK